MPQYLNRGANFMASKKVAASKKGAARPPKARLSGQSSSRADNRSRDRDNEKSADLALDTSEPGIAMTGNQGVIISDDQNSLKAGPRGPTLLEDFHLREKITHFDHERIPERVVHARGAAAHGVFELYEDLSAFTSAGVLTDTSRKTPVFVRFSTVAGSRGSADTRGTSAALLSNFTPTKATGTSSATTCRCSSSKTPSSFQT
jgi:hypothetical protein